MKTFLFNICTIPFVAFLLTGALYAQPTIIKLSAADSSASFRVLNSSSTTLLRLNDDAGFYYGGTYATGVIPTTGAGVRLMWYPAKAAFRAGRATSTQWDDANVGVYSTAMGYGTTASGYYSTAMGCTTMASEAYSTAMGFGTTASGGFSTAMGQNTTASGYASTTMGRNDTASGYYSTAMGYGTTASGYYSTAMGYGTTASGYYASTAMGYGTTASGSYSTAMGRSTTASGSYSTAMGYSTTASGDHSTAMGAYVSTDNLEGSFIVGDNYAPVTTNSTAGRQMTMRFSGGYRLFTNSATTLGVSLSANGSSWATISDSAKKTNFLKADGDYFLKSLAKLKIGSWNYKVQDAGVYRHYGPMAQEIFHYFGKDTYGTIGNDTTLATADMDGIMMICLQALEKRTAELQKANIEIAEMKKTDSEMQKRMERLENIIASMTKDNDKQITSSK
jgi:hypothetical protein